MSMKAAPSILERKVIHPGKPFIRAGEEHARAYLVQSGLISAYVMEGDQKIEVAQYEAGRIIGETCLMVDEPMAMNYEAMTDTTVATITRQDFQKKISLIDKDVMSILDHVMTKLNYQDANAIDKAKKRAEIDTDAYKIIDIMTAGMTEDRKFKYETAMLSHASNMMKAFKELKNQEGSQTPENAPDVTA